MHAEDFIFSDRAIAPYEDLLPLYSFDRFINSTSSGIITMIAKSVLFRNFNRLSSRKISGVLEEINREMIQELGNIDNYLTGILLRFSENRVEYANTGHTDLLLRCYIVSPVRKCSMMTFL